MEQKNKEHILRISAAEAQGWTGTWRFGNEHLHGTPPGKTPETCDRVNDPSDVISSQVKAGLWQFNYAKGRAKTWIS